jgi:small subunit ribosomal protein S13
MARIAGVDLPMQKMVKVGLTYIYGIGSSRARALLGKARVDGDRRVRDLSEDEVARIQRIVQEEGMVEGDLRKKTQMDIKRLIEIGSYRGSRHRRNLPVRGQRTHTNARTRKGPRKTTMKRNKPAGAAAPAPR